MSNTESNSRSKRECAFGWVLLCFFLSGFAALVYQTAWMRMFSTVFGTSELAVATVLAAYMGGLAAGAELATRLIKHSRRPVLVYAALEFGVAAGALAVPYGLALTRAIHIAWLGNQPDPPGAEGLLQLSFYLAAAFLVIGVPTACMGATLPLLTQHAVRRQDQIGSRIGLLYGLNTAGAVSGVVTAAFVLLPLYGLRGTVWWGVATNIIVVAVAIQLARKNRTDDSDQTSLAGQPPRTVASKTVQPHIKWERATLLIMLVSGTASFTYEIVWTRLLSHILGGSIHAFATMLASFLTGITLGGLIASRIAKTKSKATTGFVIAQLGTALLSAAIYLLLEQLPEWAIKLEAAAIPAGRVLLSVVVLLPSAICIGTTYPFSVRMLCDSEADAPRMSARVYSWNTVGAIFGSIMAGFFLVPTLEFAGTIKLAVTINLVLALLTACLAGNALKLSVSTAAIGGLTLLLFSPKSPELLLRTSPFIKGTAPGKIAYQEVGRSATVLMLQRDSEFELRTNGMRESFYVSGGAPPGGVAAQQRWLSALPILARPNAVSQLLIGFGGGVALENVPPNIERIDVIELEPAVIAANRAVASYRSPNPLNDPRVHVTINDARAALALTRRSWDIISSQPSHPWSAGASHLYTREFAAIVHSRLQPGGVFLQWMNAQFVDVDLLRSMGATLLDVFSNVRLYRPTPDFLLFIASDESIRIEEQLANTGEPLRSAKDYFSWLGMASVEDAVAILAVDEIAMKSLCDGAERNTDNRNLMAMSTPDYESKSSTTRLFAHLLKFAPVSSGQSALAESLTLDQPYLLKRLTTLHMRDRASAIAENIRDTTDQLIARGVIEQFSGNVTAAAEAFRQAAQVDSNNAMAASKLTEVWLPQLATGTAPAYVRQAVAHLPDSALAVVDGWTAMKANDWESVRNLEARLAEVRVTEQCFCNASYLRAMWRVNRIAEDRPLRALEAIQIIDPVLATNFDMPGCELRIDAAYYAHRHQEFIETSNQYAKLLQLSNIYQQPDYRRKIVTIMSRLESLRTSNLQSLESSNQSETVTAATTLRRRLERVIAKFRILAASN